jgi:hypothetical protein
MKTKTSELIDAALDWAVGECLDGKVSITDERGSWLVVFQPTTRGATGGGEPYPPMFFNPSTNWAQGGPIIEREKIELVPSIGGTLWYAEVAGKPTARMERCPTPLIAAMRCYVASKLGDTVDIPEELVK